MNILVRVVLLFILFLTSHSGIAITHEFTEHKYDVNHTVLGKVIYGYDTNFNFRNCCQIASDVNAQDRSFLAFVSDFLATKGTPKPRTNKLGPNPQAEGPHTQFKTDPKTGKVTGYTEFDATGNPVKRFRGQGKPHGGAEPPFILEPKPGKGPGAPPKVPRQPRPDELPRGY